MIRLRHLLRWLLLAGLAALVADLVAAPWLGQHVLHRLEESVHATGAETLTVEADSPRLHLLAGGRFSASRLRVVRDPGGPRDLRLAADGVVARPGWPLRATPLRLARLTAREVRIESVVRDEGLLSDLTALGLPAYLSSSLERALRTAPSRLPPVAVGVLQVSRLEVQFVERAGEKEVRRTELVVDGYRAAPAFLHRPITLLAGASGRGSLRAVHPGSATAAVEAAPGDGGDWRISLAAFPASHFNTSIQARAPLRVESGTFSLVFEIPAPGPDGARPDGAGTLELQSIRIARSGETGGMAAAAVATWLVANPETYAAPTRIAFTVPGSELEQIPTFDMVIERVLDRAFAAAWRHAMRRASTSVLPGFPHRLRRIWEELLSSPGSEPPDDDR